MLHSILIGLHTAAATISFITGCMVLRPRPEDLRFPLYLHVYQGALIAAVVFVIVVIGVDWGRLGLTSRAVYCGLALLAFYMIWRVLNAGRCWSRKPSGWKVAYIDHVGFTLISLFEAFVIVLLIVLGSPVWLVAAAAILGVLAGSSVVRRVQRQAGASENSA